MNHRTFTDRAEAGWMLVERLRGQSLERPLVLAIPRGGVEVGAAIARRRTMFRAVRPQADVRGRTVILTDDGVATGATMIAALHTVRAEGAKEIIVAVPVGAPDRIDAIRQLCDRVICLEEPEAFWAVGQFYRNFEQVQDERVVELLRDFGLPATQWEGASISP